MRGCRYQSGVGSPRVALWLVAVAVACSSGCRRRGAATSSAAVGAEPSPADTAEALEIFEQRCVACHGKLGKGDGPASAALNPRPRNFTSAKWQSSITDDAIERIIVYGGAAVGKSAAMPGNPDLESKPGVVRALQRHVRGLAGK